MVRGRVGAYVRRVREGLHSAFTEDHTPREIAGSFALGSFITMLPTLGVGLLAFVVLGYISDRVSKLALIASVLVFNPVVKWGVYASSFAIGVVLLGPVEGVSATAVSLDAGPALLSRLLVGNLVLATIATVLGYVVVHRLARRYQATDLGETIDDALEEVAEELLEA